MFLPTFKEHPNQNLHQGTDYYYCYILGEFFDVSRSWETRIFHAKDCLVLFDRDTEIVQFENFIGNILFYDLLGLILNKSYSGDTIERIKANMTKEFIQKKLSSGYRGIYI